MTDPKVAAARPMRLMRAPAECDHGVLCWVELGPAACNNSTAASRCLGCNGRIRIIEFEDGEIPS